MLQQQLQQKSLTELEICIRFEKSPPRIIDMVVECACKGMSDGMLSEMSNTTVPDLNRKTYSQIGGRTKYSKLFGRPFASALVLHDRHSILYRVYSRTEGKFDSD